MGSPVSSPLPALASSQSKSPSQTSHYLHRGHSPGYHSCSQGVPPSLVAPSSNHLPMSTSFRSAPARNSSAISRPWEASAFPGPSSSSHGASSSRPFAYKATSASWRWNQILSGLLCSSSVLGLLVCHKCTSWITNNPPASIPIIEINRFPTYSMAQSLPYIPIPFWNLSVQSFPSPFFGSASYL